MADLAITEQQVRQAVESGYKGFALTVDAIRTGKRERDLRASYSEADGSFEEEEEFVKEPSVKRPYVLEISFLEKILTSIDPSGRVLIGCQLPSGFEASLTYRSLSRAFSAGKMQSFVCATEPTLGFLITVEGN